MKLSAIKFQLSEQTLKNIEKSTKCSINELRTLSFDETRALLEKRNAVTKPNKIKQWFTDKYKTIGEKLGLLKKQHNFYTHID
jgi:hypothetical protein